MSFRETGAVYAAKWHSAGEITPIPRRPPNSASFAPVNSS
jgi:hypothetical protein